MRQTRAALLFVAFVGAVLVVASRTTAQAPGGDGFPFCVQFNAPDSFEPIPCPDDPVATPTPEPTSIATATPDPTPAPDPSPTSESGQTCDLIAQFSINTRNGAGIGFARIGVWEGGTTSTFDRFERVAPYLWGRHADGNWSAVASFVGTAELAITWWVYTPSDGVLCEGVPGYPAGWSIPPPEPTQPFIVGLHITNGGREALTAFYGDMREAGYQSGAKPYAATQYCLDALLGGFTCTMRWPPDHPDRIGGDDPEVSAQQYMDARNHAVRSLWEASGFSPNLIIELNNESPMENYDWWNRFYLAAIAYAERNNWPQLAIGGLGPGYGNRVMFTALKPALMANHARGGYLSSHNYAPTQYCGGDGSLSGGDIYCAFRHRLNLQIIHSLGYDVRILITEASPTDGYQPITQDSLDDIGRYTCMVQDDPGLVGIYYWNVGDFAPFADANLGPHLVALARSIATCGG